jgi:hypothetical protein
MGVCVTTTRLGLAGDVCLELRTVDAVDAGEETAAISFDREVFEGGIAHEDGAITLQLGGVEFVIARRE